MNATTFTTSWFGYEPADYASYFRICFRTEDNPDYFTFTEQDNYLTASVDMKLPFSNGINPVARTVSLAFSFDRTELERSALTATATLDFSQYSDVEMTLQQVSETMSTIANPCTGNSTTNLDLRGLCITKYFEANCGCYPLSWLWNGVLTNKNGLPICGFTAEDTTALTLFSPKQQTCIQRLCERDAQYKLQNCFANSKLDCMTSKMKGSYFKANNAVPQNIRLRVSAFQYVRIEQHPHLSSTDFIANVGGLIGVYNGAIAMTYIHILVFAVKWCSQAVVHRLARKRRLGTTLKWDNKVADEPSATRGESQTLTAMQTFAETTSFGGILYAYRGGQCERIFWCLIISLFGALTIQNLCAQVEQYNQQNTLTSININKSSYFILPSPTICLTMQSSNLWPTVVAMRESASVDVTNDTYMRSVLTSSTLSYMSKTVEDMRVNANQIKLETREKAFLLLTTCMFFDIALSETATIANERRMPRSACCDASTTASECDALTRSISKVSLFLAQQNESLVSLRQKLNMLWLGLLQMRVQGTDSTHSIHLNLTNVKAAWFGPEPFSSNSINDSIQYRICFTYSGSKSLFTFYENNGTWFWASYSSTESELGRNVLSSLSFVFSNARAAFSTIRDSTVSIIEDNYHNGTNFYVTIEQQFSFLNLRKSPCLSNQSNFDCKLNCIAQSIISQCGCMPFGLFWEGVRTDYNANSLPFCYFPMNTNVECLVSASVQVRTKVTQCQNSCSRDCNMTTVTMQEDPEHGAFPTWLAIRFAWFQCVEFNEELSMSTGELWANIGGILGVWTGACVLSYVHAVSFALKMLRLKWRQHGRPKNRITVTGMPHVQNGSPDLTAAIYSIS